MTRWTCANVESRLDLYAAGECDAADRVAIARHLDDCPACATALARSRAVLDLLDLHEQADARLSRLARRLRDEDSARSRPRSVLPFARRVGSLAAMLLLAVMLSWLPTLGPGLPAVSEDIALTIAPGRRLAPPGHQEALMMKAERADIDQVARGGPPPAPLRIDLTLTVANRGHEPIVLFPGDDATELRLDVRGPRVVRRPAPPDTSADFLRPDRLTLAPAASHELMLTELVEGNKRHLRSLYWTEAGEYVLRADYRVRWESEDGRARGVFSLSAGPVTFRVEPPSP